MAVTNSYAKDALAEAELIAESLADVTLAQIESLFQESLST
jgi:hypothetical protein